MREVRFFKQQAARLGCTGLLAMLLTTGLPCRAIAKPAASEPSAAAQKEELDDLVETSTDKAKQGQFDDAFILLRRCVRLNKHYPSCHRVLGYVHAKMGATKKAQREFRTFLKLSHKPATNAAVRLLMTEYAKPPASTFNDD